jgi:indolepyruvate ferredoxin oxidoreductase alpha subunit
MMEGPPFHLGDYKICMGGGIGAAQGLSRKIPDKPVIAFIGDSTFFHAGLPSVLNAAYNDANVLLMVFDNRWTAMTGHQPTPSTRETTGGAATDHVDIVKILKSFGVKWVRKADPFEPKKMQNVIKQALKRSGFRAIVAEGECTLQTARRKRNMAIEDEIAFAINPEKCKRCGVCYMDFGCPAISIFRDEDGEDRFEINQGLCTQCGACAQICPTHAIGESAYGGGKS